MNYILYCRKSSEAEDRQVLSLDSQETELKRLAAAEGYKIIEVYRESMSAKAPNRPLFDGMMNRIEKGEAQGVLCWKLDRLARNPVDGGKISWLLQRGVIQSIQTHDRVYRPSDNVLMMAVEFGMANQYVLDLTANVKRGNRAKLEKGGWPNMAPYGYWNDKNDKSVKIVSENAAVVRRAFELHATGLYDLRETADRLYEEGHRTPSGKRVAKSMVHKILRNSFYCGIMLKDGAYYAGKHEPIVSKDLFDKANDVLDGKNHSKVQKHFFPLRGFMTCDVCGCMLTATLQKGKYVYYYCTNGKKICDQRKKHLTAKDAEILIGSLFGQLRIDERILDIAFKAYEERFKYEEVSVEDRRQIVQNSISALEERQNRLVDSFVAGITPSGVYEQKMTTLRNERVALQTQLQQIGQGNDPSEITFEQIKNVFLTANSIANSFLDGSDEEKREYAQILLSNVSLRDQKIQKYQFKPVYQAIANIPKKDDFERVLPGRDSNPDRWIQSP